MIIRLILAWFLKSMKVRYRLTVGREDLICDMIQVHITGIGEGEMEIKTALAMQKKV